MKVSTLNYEDLTQAYVDRILFEGIQDDGEKGDCILVFGSIKANQYRVPKAVELYKANRASKIIFSGGKGIETSEGYMLEAEMMQKRAIELGVPEEDTIVEVISQVGTKENVLGTMLMIDRHIGLNRVKRILAVSTAYHMRRCQMMLETYMPDWITFSLCPAEDNNTRRENWFLSEAGSKRARLEAYKIACYIREGSLPDFEIKEEEIR